MNQFKYFYFKNNRNVGVLIAVILISSLIWNIAPFIFLAVFCIINALFLSYERCVDLPLDLELSTLATVLMTTKYGLVWGIIAAVLTKLAQIIYNSDLNMNSVFTMVGYIIAAVSAFYLPISSVVLLGIAIVLIVNIYTFIVEKFLLSLPSYQIYLYIFSNIGFNIIIFLGFSQLILNIMI